MQQTIVWMAIQKRSGVVVDGLIDSSRGANEDVIVTEVTRVGRSESRLLIYMIKKTPSQEAERHLICTGGG